MDYDNEWQYEVDDYLDSLHDNHFDDSESWQDDDFSYDPTKEF